LLLLSSDFLASSYCRLEMSRAVSKAEDGAKVVPIVIRKCDWLTLPIARFQALPGGDETIASARDLDATRASVAKSIRKIVAEILAQRSR